MAYLTKSKINPLFLLRGFWAIQLAFFWAGCSSPSTSSKEKTLDISLKYAKGFQISKGEGYWKITVNQAFPGSHEPFRYLIMEEGSNNVPEGEFNARIQLPVNSVIVTSTTHIPHLDMLGETKKLIGFPEPDLISSPKTRAWVEKSKVADLGSGAHSNVELIIDLEPDWIMISSQGRDLPNLEILQKAGMAAILNGEYLEQHPLGRAEWIKFTGTLFGKWEEAENIFNEIEKNYTDALQLTENIMESDLPTVLSGIMYKDIWYAPGNDSWGSQLLKSAGAVYVFTDQKGTGSVELNYEYVLDQAHSAAYWIGAADFGGIKEMLKADPRYGNFQSLKNGNVFTYTRKKGAKGGIEYFELGYMRPDWLLKDLIKILHPELLPEYTPYFYTKLND